MLDPTGLLYVEEAAMVKHASDGTVLCSPERQECEAIMERIRAETPSYWPNGCDISGHLKTNGSVYMIRKSASKEAIGFTGWQEFKEGQKKVGYYSIGILPEYRSNGFAKKAIRKLLAIKAASVDEVRAFIERHNTKSIGLAQALGIPIVHS
jgi:RimJ/RimL family protein N-acetyltransferase